jgi:hypothetical protein
MQTGSGSRPSLLEVLPDTPKLNSMRRVATRIVSESKTRHKLTEVGAVSAVISLVHARCLRQIRTRIRAQTDSILRTIMSWKGRRRRAGQGRKPRSGGAERASLEGLTLARPAACEQIRLFPSVTVPIPAAARTTSRLHHWAGRCRRYGGRHAVRGRDARARG